MQPLTDFNEFNNILYFCHFIGYIIIFYNLQKLNIGFYFLNICNQSHPTVCLFQAS